MSDINDLTLHLECGTLRVTPDGKRVAAYDVIKATGAGNPKQVWADLGEKYPEVVRLADHFQFAGQGQRPTPTVDREGFILLTMVLPGEGGATFRLKYKDIVIAWLEGRLVGQISPEVRYRQVLLKADELLVENAPALLQVAFEKAKGGSLGALRAGLALIETLRRGSLLTSLVPSLEKVQLPLPFPSKVPSQAPIRAETLD
jgi:hypothetical protein